DFNKYLAAANAIVPHTASENPSNDFIIIYGGPRTGTSLVCELVKHCGYNFGNADGKWNDPRGGKFEHWITSCPYNPAQESRVIKTIEAEGINAAKVIGFSEWIDFLLNHYEVKIIATIRDKET